LRSLTQTWHLDEVYLKIDGGTVYLWSAANAWLAGGLDGRRTKKSAQ
jgi:transposase-like protein